MDDDIGVAWLVKRLVVSKILKSKRPPDISDVDAVLVEANTAGRLVWSSMVPAFVRRIVGSGEMENDIAREYAHRLGTDLDEVSSKALKEGYTASLSRGIDKGLSWARVTEAWGLDGAQMRAFIGSIPDKGYTKEPVPQRSRAQLETMINTRADRIKTNEAYAIGQIAQQIKWIGMQQTGEIGPGVTKQWHTARDERVCPVCGPIDKKIVGITQTFSQGVFAPPVHPNCRCWVELQDSTIVTKRDYKRDQEGKFSTVNTYQPYRFPNKTEKRHVEQKLIGDGGVSPRFYWVKEIEHKLANADLERIKNDPNFDPSIPQIWDLKEQRIVKMPANLPKTLPANAKPKTLTRPHPLTSIQPEPVVTNVDRKPYERPDSLMDPTVKWLRDNNMVLKAMAAEREYKRDSDGQFARVNTLVSRPDFMPTDTDTPVNENKRPKLKSIKGAGQQNKQTVLLTPAEIKAIENKVYGRKTRAVAPKSVKEVLNGNQVWRDRRQLLSGPAPQPQAANKAVAKKTKEVSDLIYASKVRAGQTPTKRDPRYINFDMDKTTSVAVKPLVVETPMVIFVDKPPQTSTISFSDEPVYAYDPKSIPEEIPDSSVMVVVTGLTMHPTVRRETSPMGVTEIKSDTSIGIATGEYAVTSNMPITDEGISEGFTVTPMGRLDNIPDNAPGDQEFIPRTERGQQYRDSLDDEEESLGDAAYYAGLSTPAPAYADDEDYAPEHERAKGVRAKEGEDWTLNNAADKWLAEHDADPREFYLKDLESPFKPPRRT